MCNEILEDIETLHLSYCMADGLTNSDDMKTGGWLAETYLAFSRIMIVFIGHISEYIHHDELGILELQLMFQSLYALLSRLMSDDINIQSNIDDYIKIFLSICHFYEEDIDEFLVFHARPRTQKFYRGFQKYDSNKIYFWDSIPCIIPRKYDYHTNRINFMLRIF